MNPNSDGIKITKFAAKIVVGIGTARIASDIIKSNSRVPVGKIDKIVIPAGAFMLGMMVSDAAEKHTVNLIDDVVANVNEIRAKYKKIDKLAS